MAEGDNVAGLGRGEVQEMDFESVTEVESRSDDATVRPGKGSTQALEDGSRTFVEDGLRSDVTLRPSSPSSSASSPQPSQEATLKSSTTAAPSPTRALAPDLLRGLLMVLMAIDHNNMVLHAWPHGTAVDTEEDSRNVSEWNRPLAYVLRSLSHLCAPGFTFLLGMGVAYFGKSRTGRPGWTVGRMIRHFAVRALVLFGLSAMVAELGTGGMTWFVNIILMALGVDYVVVGLLWLGMRWSEDWLAKGLEAWHARGRVGKSDAGGDENQTREGGAEIEAEEVNEETALLSGVGELNGRDGRRGQERSVAETSAWARDLSWHVHNGLLAILVVVTIWWNIWLSPTHGHCRPPAAASNFTPSDEEPSRPFTLFSFLFLVSETMPFINMFPPFAWISFALLGLLYGRVMLSRPFPRKTIIMANTLTGLMLLTLFVLTRLFHFGNLSESCLHMPEQVTNPMRNQYLAGVFSFFYVIKYPPDVAFFALTLGGNFLLLALFDVVPAEFATKRLKVLLAYGTSALFFYVAHILVLFGLGSILVAWIGGETRFKDPATGEHGRGVTNVWIFWAHYLVVMGVMYLLCRWYGQFKKRQGPDSVWRFL